MRFRDAFKTFWKHQTRFRDDFKPFWKRQTRSWDDFKTVLETPARVPGCFQNVLEVPNEVMGYFQNVLEAPNEGDVSLCIRRILLIHPETTAQQYVCDRENSSEVSSATDKSSVFLHFFPSGSFRRNFYLSNSFFK
jgi:hypothetical protein